MIRVFLKTKFALVYCDKLFIPDSSEPVCYQYMALLKFALKSILLLNRFGYTAFFSRGDNANVFLLLFCIPKTFHNWDYSRRDDFAPR